MAVPFNDVMVTTYEASQHKLAQKRVYIYMLLIAKFWILRKELIL